MMVVWFRRPHSSKRIDSPESDKGFCALRFANEPAPMVQRSNLVKARSNPQQQVVFLSRTGCELNQNVVLKPLEVLSMKKSLLFLAAITLISTFSQVSAQPPPARPGPPKVLFIVREDIKPGMMDAHKKHSASYANLFRTLQTPNHRIALVPVAGSENEVIYLTGGESFAELESILNTTDKRMESISGNLRTEVDRLDKEAPVLHAGMRDMLAIYRPEMSYNAGVDIRQMRYFSITTTRVRPGHDAQYVDYVQKLLNVARQEAKLDTLHLAVFQIISGAPGGTYMIFRPMKSLAEMDLQLAMKMRAAMSEETRKEADKTASDAIMSSEVSTYSFTPAMSYVDKDFIAGDPAFWTPKAEAIAKPKPKRRTPRATAPSPPPAN
jgi:hypothetical protein